MRTTLFIILILLLSCTAYFTGYLTGPYKTSYELTELRNKVKTFDSTINWRDDWLDHWREEEAYITTSYLQLLYVDMLSERTNTVCDFLRYKIDSIILLNQANASFDDDLSFSPTSDKWLALITEIAEFRKKNPSPYDCGFPFLLGRYIDCYNPNIDTTVYEAVLKMKDEKPSNKASEDTSQ